MHLPALSGLPAAGNQSTNHSRQNRRRRHSPTPYTRCPSSMASERWLSLSQAPLPSSSELSIRVPRPMYLVRGGRGKLTQQRQWAMCGRGMGAGMSEPPAAAGLHSVSQQSSTNQHGCCRNAATRAGHVLQPSQYKLHSGTQQHCAKKGGMCRGGQRSSWENRCIGWSG